jgi:hypothetical protein
MKYEQPYGVSDPNAPYINGNPSTGTMGSIPPAAAIENPQREIVNLISDAGLSPADTDMHQLAKGVQCGRLNYAVDAGTAAAYQAVFVPPLDSYYDGLAVWLLPAHSNSGPATFDGGPGPRNIVRRGGAALVAGDMPADFKSLLTYNAKHGNFELYGTGFTIGGFQPILTANTTLYVNAATGDDSAYDGTTATVSGPHGPFKTIGRAISETFKYGPSLYTMTINVAAGTYPETVTCPSLRGPTIIMNGAGQSSTFVTGATDQHTFYVGGGNVMYVSNMYVSQPGGPMSAVFLCSCFVCANGGQLFTNNITTGSAPGGFIFFCSTGGIVWCGNHGFASGSVAIGIWFADAGIIELAPAPAQVSTYTFGGVFTLTGSPGATVFASAGGAVIQGPPPYAPVFQNSGFLSSGYKFYASFNGAIVVNGQPPSFFPGANPGILTTGGQYG